MKNKRVYRRYRFSAGGHCLGYTEHRYTTGETIKMWLVGLTVIGAIMYAGYWAATIDLPTNLKVNPMNEIAAFPR